MYNLKTIVTYRLGHNDLKLLNERVKKHGEYQVLETHQINDLLDLTIKDIASLFIYVDESVSLGVFEEIVRYFKAIPINIILKHKDFDMLMLAYRYQINYVFEEKLKEFGLENSLVKISLLERSGARGAGFPLSEVLSLFSTPVKIKTNEDLFYKLSNYFKNFSAVRKIAIIEQIGDESFLIGEKIPSVIYEEIAKLQTPRLYIGTEYRVSDSKTNWLVTPVMLDESRVWLLVDVSDEAKSKCLNDLFYKYLENVLIYRLNKRKEEKLKVLSITDEVTGLYNQRKLAQDLEAAVIEHEKEHGTFSLMFIDVDHFKDVNDSYGHIVGSKLLIDIGKVLRSILRESDHIYRYGGDEFVVIMPRVNISLVHDIASRVLKKIKANDFAIENGDIYKLSVSIGIAEYPTDAKSAVDIIKFADEMMYMSKRSGRGKVFHVKEVANVNTGTK